MDHSFADLGKLQALLVVQGAKALTASNRRTVGRGCPEGRG